ncbi:MAG: DUF6308 family protein [Thermodesulfobacteriota bacterium]
MEMRFGNGIVLKNPEDRIREYCEIEVYRGFDDCHTIDDEITENDISAANTLYAMINRYDPTESQRILNNSSVFSSFLHKIGNTDLGKLSNNEWSDVEKNVRPLLREFTSLEGIGLGKTFKILHLKRPNLFPILDKLVVEFLTGIDTIPKMKQVEVGLRTILIARDDIVGNQDIFKEMGNKLSDLPIPLTTVRLYDILCWTEEKWAIKGNRNAKYGMVSRTISDPLTQKEFQKRSMSPCKAPFSPKGIFQNTFGIQYVVYEDIHRASGPKVHTTDCGYYKKWLAKRSNTTTWHGPYGIFKEAWEKCGIIAEKTHFKPSKHTCVYSK